MKTEYILGIDIGGTNIRLALVDKELKLSNEFITEIANLKKDFIKGILKIIRENFAEDIKAVIFGIPGIVNKNKIISCPNVIELEKANLKIELEKKLKVPVYIEKDVNLIMLAEYSFLADNPQNVLGFFIGTGFGFSMILNGKLYTGTRGFAGELGHIPVPGAKEQCNCGNKGCLELYAAGKKISHLTKEYQTNIENFFIDFAGRQESQAIIENILFGIIVAVNILDPEVIILGGGVFGMRAFPLDYLIKEIKNRVRNKFVAEQLQIMTTKQKTFGGCLGAGIYGFNKIYA
ncbi:allose kinase [Halanaerobium salsuginis]|jgi:allose kinase|uniref:Allose kinase n=1 Tax=Halanaerobium salsuginis TaxID=29563 RepID=A0A1I4I448_9FIRM|nr:allose kinase [Halanaerobium salsuginis]SFL48581.1 allose kinase [Halanaerobium salsuginis]